MTNAARKLQEDVPGIGDSASSILQDSAQRLLAAMAERALSSVSDRVSSTSDRLNDYAEGGGGGLLAALTGSEQSDEDGSPLGSRWEGAKQMVKDKASDVKDAVTGGGDGGGGGGKSGGKGKKLKLTNIVESIDVGVPVQLAYNQWTQFADFPSFMKKVERVEQESDEKLEWKAQVFLSHRTWESTIIEQVPDERIVWRSKGAKGFVDGAVTFHEVTPDLTRILVILEYHPKGFFEKTGNLWRAPGRRARLELKHFQRHIMTQAVLHPDEVVGWRGEIRDGEVVEPEESEEPEDTGEDEDYGAETGEQETEGPEDTDEEYGTESDEEETEEPEEEEAEEPEDTDEDEEYEAESEEEEPEEPEEEEAEEPPARRRGRPRKAAAAATEAPVRRGRPRKTAAATEAPPARRGRPRKAAAAKSTRSKQGA